MGENRSEAARDPRIPDHCGWAARGLWNKAYDALLLDNAALREEVDALIAATLVATDKAIREAVLAVWERCEALEDEAYKALETAEMTDHQLGFWRGQKLTAKSIRRSTEMPRALATNSQTDALASVRREARAEKEAGHD